MKKKHCKFYDTLGVKPEASQDEIKKAFRNKAKGCHPDHHPGDEQKEGEFKELSIAYCTLSDADSRRQYDESGEARQVDTVLADAYGLIVEVFRKLREAEADEVFFIDPFTRMRSFFESDKREAQGDIEKLNRENRRIDKLISKIVHKKGNRQSFLHFALGQEKDENEAKVKQIERAIAVLSKASAVLDEFRFETDRRPGASEQIRGRKGFVFPGGLHFESVFGFDYAEGFQWKRARTSKS